MPDQRVQLSSSGDVPQFKGVTASAGEKLAVRTECHNCILLVAGRTLQDSPLSSGGDIPEFYFLVPASTCKRLSVWAERYRGDPIRLCWQNPQFFAAWSLP